MSKTRNIGRRKFLRLFFTRIIKDIPPHNLIAPFLLDSPVAITAKGVFYSEEITAPIFKFALNFIKRYW